MSSSKAFLFDLNGTIIDDMTFHVDAWSAVLANDLNKPMSYPEVKAQMYGKSTELLDRVFGAGHFSSEEADRIVMDKEIRYQQIYRPHLSLIDGLGSFLEKAQQQQIPMAIGSAAIMFNVDFVIDNLDIRKYFGSLISADQVKLSKPDPETFTKAAEELGYAPENCIVFEDAPKGVEAARNAGMKAVVILSKLHGKDEFADYDNIIRFIHSYDEIEPSEL